VRFSPIAAILLLAVTADAKPAKPKPDPCRADCARRKLGGPQLARCEALCDAQSASALNLLGSTTTKTAAVPPYDPKRQAEELHSLALMSCSEQALACSGRFILPREVSTARKNACVRAYVESGGRDSSAFDCSPVGTPPPAQGSLGTRAPAKTTHKP
jgi:hypothetical protein